MAGDIQGSITYQIKVATEKAKKDLDSFINKAKEASSAASTEKLGERDYEYTERGKSNPWQETEDAAEGAKEAIFEGASSGGAVFGGVENSLTYLRLQLQQAEANARECALVLQDLANSGASIDSPQVATYVQRLGEAEREAVAIRQQINALNTTSVRPSFISTLTDGAKRILSSFKDIGKQSSSTFSNLVKGSQRAGNSFLKMGLTMIGVRSIFAALRKAVNAYMSENEGLQGKLSGIWSSLGNVLGPVIERVINLLGTAIGYISKFLSALGSIGGIALGNSKALNKQAKATSGAGGAAAKAQRQLAGFDEMNKLSDTSSGGGGGGGGASTYDWASAVTMPDWANLMIESIKNGDWYGGGAVLGEKFTEMFMSIDWAKVGKAIGDAIHNLMSFISGFFEHTDWVGLGQSIATAIKNVNWTRLVQDLARLLGNIIGALAGILKGLFGDAWNGLVKWWNTNAMEGGKFTIEGFLEGIKEAFKNIWNWIVENIWKPFSDGFNKAFGIASPSKKMKEIGGYIVEGLKIGIQNGIASVVAKATEIWTKIKSVFGNVGTFFKDVFSTAWNNIKSVFSGWTSFFGNLWNSIKNTFSGLGTSLGSAIAGSVRTAINGVISKIQNTINTAVSIINGAIGVINKLPNVSVGRVPTVSLPRLARGAIVNNPRRGVPAIVGEAGKEAVLPLENNTEWMDLLAERLGGSGNVTIPIYMNEKKIAEYMVDVQKKRAFALNGGY